MTTGKRVTAVIAGIFTGWIIVAVGDYINGLIFVAPDDLDYTDTASLEAFVNSLPISAFLGMLFTWAISAFSGGLVTGLLGRAHWKNLSLITGFVLLLANVANMFVIPQPLWLNITTFFMYLPLAFLGGRMAVGKESVYVRS